MTASSYTLVDLARLDIRLEANLRGLTLAGDAGWAACVAQLGQGPAEIFPATLVALRDASGRHVPAVLEALAAEPRGATALVSALGWSSLSRAEPLLRALQSSEVPALQRAAVAGYAAHRTLPDPCMDAARTRGGPAVLARGLRAIGEVALVAKAPTLEPFLAAGDHGVRLWAAWSLLLCAPGHAGALEALVRLVPPAVSLGRLTEIAVDTLARSLQPTRGRELHRTLREANHPRLALLAAHAGGWPETLDEVVRDMADPRLARVAGLTFTQVTGLDLGHHDLEGEPAEDDEPEDARDALLPWPDPARVAKRWSENRGHYAAGARYLRGEIVSEESVTATLRVGTQAQRRAAALERSRLHPGTPVYPTARAGFLQARDLLGWM